MFNVKRDYPIKKALYLPKYISSNMRKIYMARKVKLIVIWPSSEAKMAVLSHVKWDYPIKKALYLPYHC